MAISSAVCLQTTGTFDEVPQCFPLHKLHCVEIVVADPSEVEDRGDVCVAHAGSRTRLAQKTKPSRFILEILFTDDLQRHRASEIDVERLVSDPHRAATQLDRFPAFARHQLVVVESLRWLVRYRLERILSRRLAGLNPTAKALTKHADRAEFHCPRESIAATRADALGHRVHAPNRPSAAF